jgi:hypothetical protein
MSDLVEKVAQAMCADAGFDPFDVMANDGPRWRYYEPQARAAIKAVAEWFDKQDKESVGGISVASSAFYMLITQLKEAANGR